jgi:hypothetical protein
MRFTFGTKLVIAGSGAAASLNKVTRHGDLLVDIIFAD